MFKPKTIKISICIAFVILISLPGSVMAQEDSWNMTTATIKMVGALSIILAVLFIAIWVIKKVSPSSHLLGTGSGLIKVISSHPIGPKKTLVIVRVCGKYMVLGVTDQSINLINEIKQDEFNSELSSDEKIINNMRFGSIIRKLMKVDS